MIGGTASEGTLTTQGQGQRHHCTATGSLQRSNGLADSFRPGDRPHDVERL